MKLPHDIQGRWLCLLLAAVIGIWVCGCASTESENASSKPWNSPEGWQGGSLPGMMQSH